MLTSPRSYLVGLKPLMQELEEEHVHLAVLPYSIFSQGLVLVHLIWERWEEIYVINCTVNLHMLLHFYS